MCYRILLAFLINFLSFSVFSQSRYLKIKIDSAANFGLREVDWLVGTSQYPSPDMTSYNAPSPLVTSGHGANWARHLLYDGDPSTHLWTGAQVYSDEHLFFEVILDLGAGNGITPDSIAITKEPWMILQSFEVYFSNDNVFWEKYLDTTLTIVNFAYRTFPLERVLDVQAPSDLTNLLAKYVMDNSTYLIWDPSTDDIGVDYYNIYQDGLLIDSTKHTNFVVNNLTPNTNYILEVRARDLQGNLSVPGQVMISTLSTDNIAPILTGSVTLDSVNAERICFSWPAATDNQNIDGYRILYNGRTIVVSDTNYACIPGLQRDSTYSFEIIAQDYTGNISSSLTVSGTTLDVEVPMKVGSNFWYQGWSQEDNQLFINGWQNVTGDNPWKPTLISDIMDYAVTLRYMEMQRINFNPIFKWMDRIQKRELVQVELAYEWMIDLCNRTNTNLYVCIPNAVVDSTGVVGGQEHYIKKLALLIKTGIDMLDVDLDVPAFDSIHLLTPIELEMLGGVRTSKALNSDLQVYIEYGNENWNVNFPQQYYNVEHGLAMNLFSGPLGARNLFTAYGSIKLFEGFDAVFGNQSTHVKRILPIQRMDAYWLNQMFLQIFDSPIYNPTGVLPDDISGHTYFGHGLDGSAPDIIDQLCTSIQDYIPEIEFLRTYLDQQGTVYNKYFGMTSYEGGHHVITDFSILNQNPEIYKSYLVFLNSYQEHFEEILFYSHVATNSFGLKQYIEQPIADAHKYRAVIHYLQDRADQSTNVWLGGDGNWNDACNWRFGHIPNQNEDVIFNGDNLQSVNILPGEDFSCRTIVTPPNTSLNVEGILRILIE